MKWSQKWNIIILLQAVLFFELLKDCCDLKRIVLRYWLLTLDAIFVLGYRWTLIFDWTFMCLLDYTSLEEKSSLKCLTQSRIWKLFLPGMLSRLYWKFSIHIYRTPKIQPFPGTFVSLHLITMVPAYVIKPCIAICQLHDRNDPELSSEILWVCLENFSVLDPQDWN